ncbi:response regulator [Marinifilum sp. N1E240]|uniref:response regulator transcription factor n=1 Tax=Marinifilum sp. N1E240 TaxID=2608082 RepID=UPI00128BF30F|nr:response regulator transcription factor [Marinifilum sp. N1E240]MPQ48128.1 response regulator [Marinifilum sp. N1E240]
MRKICVIFVDDDINLGNLVCTALETDYGYCVHFQNTMAGINNIIPSINPDIIILDVEIGRENGIEKAKEIIENYPQIPLIFVSSHTKESFITEGISIGANAYLPKPLSIPILASYIKRYTNCSQSKAIIKVASYELNLSSSELIYEKKLLKKLSPFEKNTLELLMNHANKTVSREQLAKKLWGHSLKEQNIASIHNTISKLRDLFKTHNRVKINTIRNIGYILQY